MDEELEDVRARHRKEKKALQGKILQLKKSVSNGDKKRAKEVQAQVLTLEKELQDQQEKEIQEFLATHQSTPPLVQNGGDGISDESNKDCKEDGHDRGKPISGDANNSADSPKSAEMAGDLTGHSTNSRAQKRREKRTKAVQNRAKAMEQSAQDYETSSGKIELDTLTRQLASLHLKLCEIRGDGNCLFTAVSHQLEQEKISATILRHRVAQHLLEHRDHYAAFVELDPVDEQASDPFSAYCSRIETTNAWAGNLEIDALSKVLQRRIEILQANEKPCVLGEEFSNKADPIVLVYHRHMYGAGGHYNSVQSLSSVSTDG